MVMALLAVGYGEGTMPKWGADTGVGWKWGMGPAFGCVMGCWSVCSVAGISFRPVLMDCPSSSITRCCAARVPLFPFPRWLVGTGQGVNRVGGFWGKRN